MKSRSTDVKGENFKTKIIDFVETTIVVNKDKKGMGLEIVGGIDTYLGGIVISDIAAGGAAEKDGRIKVGDQILGVNGESLKNSTHKEAVTTLRLATSPVRMVILREDPERIFTTTEEPTIVKKVVLKKSINQHLGLSILARRDKKGVFVTNVAEKSIADFEGTIQQGDRIMEVNGETLRHATQEQATQIIRRAYGTVKIKIGRIKSLNASLQLDSSAFSFTNLGLEDEKGGNLRRYNSFGYDWMRRKQKISTDRNQNVESSRPRSRSIQREFSTTAIVKDGLPKYTALIHASSSDSQSSDNGTDGAVLPDMITSEVAPHENLNQMKATPKHSTDPETPTLV